MHYFEICMLAFVAMVIQDVLGVMQTQANARNNAHLSGVLDMLGWVAAIATTSISVDAINGHNFLMKALVITSVSIANYIGSVMGVRLGERFIKQVVPVED